MQLILMGLFVAAQAKIRQKGAENGRKPWQKAGFSAIFDIRTP